jgi:hypothetical protein
MFLYFRAPEYFDNSWLSKIKTDVSTNWRLKVIIICKKKIKTETANMELTCIWLSNVYLILATQNNKMIYLKHE